VWKLSKGFLARFFYDSFLIEKHSSFFSPFNERLRREEEKTGKIDKKEKTIGF